jgi:hypothetical protein
VRAPEPPPALSASLDAALAARRARRPALAERARKAARTRIHNRLVRDALAARHLNTTEGDEHGRS